MWRESQLGSQSPSGRWGGDSPVGLAAQNLPCLSVISDLVSEREESQTDFYRTAEQKEATASWRVAGELEEPERPGWATTRGVTTGEWGEKETSWGI